MPFGMLLPQPSTRAKRTITCSKKVLEYWNKSCIKYVVDIFFT